mgnify:CR=1 FL=1
MEYLNTLKDTGATSLLLGGMASSIVTSYLGTEVNPILALVGSTTGSIAISKISNEIYTKKNLYPLVNNIENYIASIRQSLGLNHYSLSIDHESIVYPKIMSYIINKHKDILVSNNVSYKLENVINLNEIKFNNIIIETYVVDNITHSILLSLNCECHTIVLQSKTLNVSGLENFSKYMTSQNINITNIVLYQPTITRIGKNGNDLSSRVSDESKAKTIISWDCFNVYTNKTLKNTMVSSQVKENFLDDLKNFMDNEDYYNTKGIPYKRGYMLYGPPGTGKTSLVKAIANTYGMDVYLINMEDVKTAEDITKLFRGFHNTNSYHIVCFEDIDRCSMFKKKPDPRYFYGDPTPSPCIRAFLNELDGISEGNKRITIFTANDTSVIDQTEALCRPGRIDKKIEVGYCDYTQLNELFNHYTCSNTKLELSKLDKNITPAEAIKLILEDNLITSDEFKTKLDLHTEADKNVDMDGNLTTNAVPNTKGKSRKRKEMTQDDKISKMVKLIDQEHKKSKTIDNKLIKRLDVINDNLDNNKITQLKQSVNKYWRMKAIDHAKFTKKIDALKA